MVILYTCQAYDHHLNIVLGEVEEIVTTVELDEETFEEIYKVNKCYLCWKWSQDDLHLFFLRQLNETFQCCLSEAMVLF